MAISYSESTKGSMDISVRVDDGQISPIPVEAQIDAAAVSSTKVIIADLAQRNIEKIRVSKEMERNNEHARCSNSVEEHNNGATNTTTTTTIITVPEGMYSRLSLSLSAGERSPATTINALASTNASIIVADDTQGIIVKKRDEEKGVVESVVIDPGEGFPDGGRKAWLCVLGTWLCLFSAFGLMNAIGVFQAYYKAYLLPEYTDSQLSWIMGFYLFFVFAGGVFAGTIFDIYGPTYLIIGGTFCLPFGMVLISISTKYWHLLLAQSFLVGGGTAMTFYASISSVTTWFYHRRAMAIGIASTGGGVGGIFFPLVVSHLLHYLGFAWTTRLFGLVYLATLSIACILVKSRLTHAKSLKARRIVLFDFAAFKEPAWSFFGAGCFVQLLGLWGPINYLASFALANGFSASMAFYMIAFLNGGSIFGRALPGLLGDRFGRITMFIIFSTISGFLILAMWSQLHSQAGIIAFAILYGFSSGAFLSIYAACAASQLTKNVSIIGQRLGTLNVLTAISSLIALPISGSLVDHMNDFTPLIWFSGAMMLTGSCFLVVARYYAGGKKWRVTV
ncbi:hypothetical protein EYR41_004398 [Orbilia oligospora]|uniref:Major facilitator superfamily (MFS) profile domain-containing protein n=1 Tax=Orbilia oligospora TaxID=2813651 RepID=A0A8H2E866_ORBOL|nr:hypothetical protein EYR41_004398 [Orbilia oligospora]